MEAMRHGVKAKAQWSFPSGCYQARSQKFAIGGFVRGVWGLRPHLPKTDEGLGVKPLATRGQGWGLGAKPPVLENFAFFCKNNLNLRLF